MERRSPSKRARKQRHLFDPTTSSYLGQNQVNEGMVVDDDAATCQTWETMLKPRDWFHIKASGLETWHFSPGSLRGIDVNKIKKNGKKGVHWCTDYRELKVMIKKFGVIRRFIPIMIKFNGFICIDRLF